MRVLWISHDPIRISGSDDKSYSGYWKESLLKLLSGKINIKVAYPGTVKSKEPNGNYTFRHPIHNTYASIPKSTIQDLKWIIADFKPDLIHIHGTEKTYGLISKYTSVPLLISLQGFITESCHHVLGEIPLPIWQKEKTFKELLFRNSFPDIHKYWYYNSEYEKEIIRINKYFIGRTDFDKKFVCKLNPDAQYFIGNELLRDEFTLSDWNLKKINKHSIFTTSFTNPLKGFHILLESVNYLKIDFPNTNIIVPGFLTPRMYNRITGNAYYRVIRKLIFKYKLQDSIHFSGKLDEFQICRILEKANVFVLSSFIENSSNALGEAQTVGTPCIVPSNCGGISSMIKDQINGLYFNKGDAYDLSLMIRKVFSNDDLAESLSKNSKLFGSGFHNQKNILNQYSSIYKKIVNDESSS